MKPVVLRFMLATACCACLPGVHAETARVIVKYRADSSMLWQSNETTMRSMLSARTGEQITTGHRIGRNLQAVQAEGTSTDALIEKLAAQTDVEYVLPDQFRFPHAVSPNDQYFSGQWYLQAADAAAIDAVDAWTAGTGSSSIVVAVLDTGILPMHPDVNANILFSNGSVYGYDFISTTAVANDNSGRDADPSDPGDWLTSSDISSSSTFSKCSARGSSWHGTMVASVIGAGTNNTIGLAGTAWNVRILPVRVLGKCGGYDSDIMDAMLWAAGISVAGVPDNQYPARVINLSLGSTGGCDKYYEDLINEILQQGTLIVASAGNNGSSSVNAPAKCPGVLAVSAVTNLGNKTGYSNFGSEIALSAPGGSSCSSAFTAAVDSSTTSPSGIYTYTTCGVGTSFSAPLVSGVAALMLAHNPALSPAQLTALLKSSATAFPAVSGLSSCTTTTSQNTECNCTTGTCGAGMLNAYAAIQAAAAQTSSSSSSASPTTNSGSGSGGGGGGGGGAIDPLDALIVLLACLAAYAGIRRHR